jgi:tetratricopeptide (TPR) repeat protein
VLDLGAQDITLAPARPVRLTLEKPWKRPTLWEPDNPHLYALRVTIRDAGTGTVLDVRRDRFGFRESWIDGPNIMFNGYPIKPVGYGYLMRLNPRGNFMFLRGGGREWLDEIGIMGYYGISGLRNTPSQHNIESDTFWRTAESNNIAALRLRQNSPHILAWDLSNEWLCFFWGDPMQGARRFKALSDAVRAYDPTRWTLANAERDLNGLLDNYSFHYMSPYYGPPNKFTMRGVTPYLPDESFWRPLDRPFAVGEAVAYCPLNPMLLRPDQKVIMDNEFLWKCGDYMPPGPTTIMGEDNVLSAAVDTGSGPAAWLWKTLLDGHRDMGVSTINVYSYHPGVVRGAFLEQALIIPENQRHGFAGTRHTRRFTIVNSLFRPHTLTLRWRLDGPDGSAAARGRESFQMGSGDIRRGQFAFTLPKVAARSTCTLRVMLESDGPSTGSGQGGFVCGEEWDIRVDPSAVPDIGTLARKVLLYDPEGTTAAALTALKVPFTKVGALTPLAGAPAETTVIVGESALNPYSARITASLSGFVEQGGRVVILAQKGTPSNLPVETVLEPRNWSSQVYPRAGSHPVLADIGSHDLQFWQPDRSVGVGAYTKPFSGNFIALADGSFWGKMDWAQMMEVFRGRGAYLLCQLPVASRQEVEPVARQLLVNIVRHACGPDAYACPVKTLAAVTEPAGDTVGILQNFRIKHRVIGLAAEAEAGTPVLLDADYARQAGAEQRARWRERLRQGGEWVVLNAEPQDSAWLAELAGSRVEIAVPPYPLWDGRGFRKGWSKYTAGLSHLDLYRKRYSDDERAGGQAEDLTNILEPFQNYAAHAEQGRELLFPGALVEIRTGKGVLLLDQRRWAAQDEYLAKLVRRNVSALMTALNVGMASYVAPRALPKDLAFRTIDVASRATVRLQAPGAAGAGAGLPALPGFPNAPRNFLNIPFALNTDGKNGIALAATRAGLPTGLPEHVTIPVGFVAEGLYFLQAAGQAGAGLVANYQVVYEDGSVFDVPVRGGVHVADWNAPAVVPEAEIAWTGSDGQHPITAVYRMLWVNHRPETPIKEVVFSNPEAKSVPVLIGVTAAARRETIPVPPEQAARAQQAFQKGKTAFQQGRPDEAFNHLRDAVVADPALKDAYQALADAAEKKGDEDRMFEAYRLWSLSGPRQPLPWNRMGEIHEKRKQTRPALDAYRKSLEIEWNQPPVMDAIRRLEADLK